MIPSASHDAMPVQTRPETVALIGSFRQHYQSVMTVFMQFHAVGLRVTSPKGSPILDEGVPFVRFETDPRQWCDAMVQSVALHRILLADFVYAVLPDGYVGRTTCYEIGRIVQARRPLYFSNPPEDLPVSVPEDHVCTAAVIAAAVRSSSFTPAPLWIDGGTEVFDLERDLLDGQYRHI